MYLHKYDSSVTLNSTLVIGPLLSITQSMTALLGPFLLKRVNVRILMTIGSIIALGGIWISSYVTNLYLFILFFGAFYGWGMGIWYLIPLVWWWEHFPKRKGLMSGIIIGGFGFGSFFFGFISFAIANPNNSHPELDVDGGKIFGPETPEAEVAPKLIRINCAIWAVLALIGIIFVSK